MIKQTSRIEGVCKSILRAKSIAISGHANPDGDSIGSLLALGLALESIGKEVYMLCHDEIPPHYRSLPGVNRIVRTTDVQVDLAIAVDCSTIDVLGKNVPVFKNAKSILEIDHHKYRKPFGDIQFIDHEASAVGEMIYLILRKLNVKMTRPIAENLLTSIIVETNLFRLANVRRYTFKVCEELLATGLNFFQLTGRVYGPKTRKTMMLLAICMMRAKFLRGGRFIWSILTAADLKKVGAKDYDADAIADEMCSLKGVDIALLFREKKKSMLRVSMRSRNGIDIGELAQRYKGGGHFDIAGCYIPNRKQNIRKLISDAEKILPKGVRA